MKTALAALLAFTAGALFGSTLLYRATAYGIRRANLEQTANMAVGDMEQAYEGQLERSGVTKKFQDCLSENARLKTRAFINTGVTRQ